MSFSPLIAEMKFHFLRDFAEWASNRIAQNIEEIKARAEEGDFRDYGAYEAATDYPLLRHKFAAEAVMHLLNAYVDEQIRQLLESSFEPKIDPKKPELLSEKTAKIRFPQLISRVECAYGISFSNIEGWDDYLRIRETVNALKHRSGKRNLAEIFGTGGGANEFSYEITLEQAQKDIDICLNLVRRLHVVALRHARTS